MLEFAKPFRIGCLIRSPHHVIEVDKERIINIIFADEDETRAQRAQGHIQGCTARWWQSWGRELVIPFPVSEVFSGMLACRVWAQRSRRGKVQRVASRGPISGSKLHLFLES